MCVLKLQRSKPHLVDWHMLMINKWRKSKPSILPLRKYRQIHNAPFSMSWYSCLGQDLEFFKGWDLMAMAELIKVTEMTWAILLPPSWFTDSRITVTTLLWKPLSFRAVRSDPPWFQVVFPCNYWYVCPIASGKQLRKSISMRLVLLWTKWLAALLALGTWREDREGEGGKGTGIYWTPVIAAVGAL